MELSGKRVAPALKTLLMEYGQSFADKIGFAGCRVNKISCWIIVSIKSNLPKRKVAARQIHKEAKEARIDQAFGSVVSASSNLRISRRAMRKDRVDSAPWFSLARSGWRPSRQPPVVGS